MVKLYYLEDKDGNQQVFDLIADIATKGMTSSGYANLSKYIAQGLEYLESIGVPPNKFLPFVTETEEGYPLTFASILKELKYHPPLFEFRINWREVGWFRAIFFYIEQDGEQHIYFTKALIKQEPNPPEFLNLITESEQILKEFLG